MKKHSITNLASLFCLILLNVNSFSQKVHINIKVINNENNPVAYATLNFLQENKQYVCNVFGNFEGFAHVNDTVLITSVGFSDTTLFIKDLIKHPNIVLRHKISEMKEVIVKSGKRQSVGDINLREDRSIVGGDSSTPIFEIVKLMKTNIINKEFRIVSVSFRQKKFYPEMPLMLHIYAINSEGLPGRDLLIDSQYMVRQEMFHNDIITFDVRSANIILKDEDFFVGLQFLHPFDEKWIVKNKLGFGNDLGIFETKKERDALTYRRSNKFKHYWYAEYTKGLIFPKQDQIEEKRLVDNTDNSILKPINLIAGVEIEILKP